MLAMLAECCELPALKNGPMNCKVMRVCILKVEYLLMPSPKNMLYQGIFRGTISGCHTRYRCLFRRRRCGVPSPPRRRGDPASLTRQYTTRTFISPHNLGTLVKAIANFCPFFPKCHYYCARGATVHMTEPLGARKSAPRDSGDT